jgi:hypothetical protein
VPAIHDVPELHRSAVAAGLPELSREVLARFPKEKKVSKHRYGVTAPPSLKETVELYDAALTLGLHCASHCTHTLSRTSDLWIELRTIGSLGRAE